MGVIEKTEDSVFELGGILIFFCLMVIAVFIYLAIKGAKVPEKYYPSVWWGDFASWVDETVSQVDEIVSRVDEILGIFGGKLGIKLYTPGPVGSNEQFNIFDDSLSKVEDFFNKTFPTPTINAVKDDPKTQARIAQANADLAQMAADQAAGVGDYAAHYDPPSTPDSVPTGAGAP